MSAPVSPNQVKLRAAYVWNDEVMHDVVLTKPAPITLGDADSATFVTPEMALPLDFAIIRPGNRGYLLTLGEHMAGTICIDGNERDVAEFVRRGGEGEVLAGFRATPIGGGDWGLVDLDGTGTHKIFFQFVPSDPLPKSPWRDPGLLLPAAAFSMLFHVAILFITYQFESSDAMVWPGQRSLTGEYLVTRLQPQIEEEPKKDPPATAGAAEAAPKSGDVKNVKSAAKNAEGAAGGAGDIERARNPNANEDEKPAPPRIGLFTDKNRKTLDNIINQNLKIPTGNFTGVKGDTLRPGSLGFGPGTGTGAGEGVDGTGTTRGSKGKGPGGGGNVDGDYVTKKGPIDTGETRTAKGTGGDGIAPKELAVKVGQASGDFSGLSREEIDKVIRARSGVFKACYQKELNRTRDLGGKMVVGFTIGADGSVKSTRVENSSLNNSEVEGCIKSNIARLKFPAKGGAIVTYPFIFSQGG
ncbi:MAG TPA: AgmX/PglI C-terminal domain-containing protein [Kofleriaceae bacterium]|nr:AgmX/PglI C-terminal domain-containing protein [Kofleriaceae bacterium]